MGRRIVESYSLFIYDMKNRRKFNKFCVESTLQWTARTFSPIQIIICFVQKKDRVILALLFLALLFN